MAKVCTRLEKRGIRGEAANGFLRLDELTDKFGRAREVPEAEVLERWE